MSKRIKAIRTKNAHGQFDSRFEAGVAGEIMNLGFQHEGRAFTFHVPRKYNPDFVDSERKIIVEMKGHIFPTSKDSIKLIPSAYPDWKCIIWFQDPNLKMVKKGKLSYADFAKKNGWIVVASIEEIMEIIGPSTDFSGNTGIHHPSA